MCIHLQWEMNAETLQEELDLCLSGRNTPTHTPNQFTLIHPLIHPAKLHYPYTQSNSTFYASFINFGK